MKNYCLLIGLLLLLLLPFQTAASHLMGADITWKCKGNDTFFITVTVYRDCNGNTLSGGPIELVPMCGGSNLSFSTTMSDLKDVTPICKGYCTRCSSSTCSYPYGVQQNQQTATVVFPQNTTCCNWNVSWQQCCRSTALTTVVPDNFYIEASLNRCQNPCDNSPYFSKLPIAITCNRQCTTLNPGIADNDKSDSLASRLVVPLINPGSPIQYNSGYTYKTPLKYNGFDPDAAYDAPNCYGFHFDNQTGELSFKPSQTDVTVLAFAVDEYRKDTAGIYKKTGSARRDLELIIMDCPEDQPPIVYGINGTSISTAYFCTGLAQCFRINTFDPDPYDTVMVSWNAPKRMKGATFDNSENGSKKWPRGIFCWNPSDSFASSLPYSFLVTATDNACPVHGRVDRTVSVYVSKTPQVTYKANVVCNSVTFSATSKDSIIKRLWQGNDAFGKTWSSSAVKTTHQFQLPGTHKYSLSVTGFKPVP